MSTKFMQLPGILGLVFLALSAPAFADVWYVDKDRPGGDGTSWEEAFREVQPAVDAAFADGGGEAWIAEGVYDELRDSPPSPALLPAGGALVMRDGVQLYGGFGGMETARDERSVTMYESVLDGSTSMAGAAAKVVVQAADGTVVDGLTIRGGTDIGIYADSRTSLLVSNCEVIENGGGEYYSCGILARECGIVTIGDSGFLANEGSALYVTNCEAASVSSCDFTNNAACGSVGALSVDILDSHFTGVAYEERGAGLYVYATNLTMSGCVIESCYSRSGPGGLDISGRGEASVVEVRNCRFLKNESREESGGIEISSADRVLVEDCEFIGNSARSEGGALTAYGIGLEMRNCEFRGNEAGSGGALYVWGSEILADRCLFVDNKAVWAGGAIRAWAEALEEPATSIRVTNSAFVRNHCDLGEYRRESNFEMGEVLYAENYYEWPCLGKTLSAAEGEGEGEGWAEGEGSWDGEGSCLYVPGGDYHGILDTPGFYNCTFVDNGGIGEWLFYYRLDAPEFWQGMTAELKMANCIVSGDNTELAGADYPEYLVESVDYSRIPGGHAGVGNTSLDPLFFSPAQDDYRLRYDSPCIDTGRDTSGEEFGAIVEDFAGWARPFDGDGLGAGSTGDGSDYDMGAHEFARETECPADYHAADVNTDGVISLSELLRVVQFFNAAGVFCAPGTEDGYAPAEGEYACCLHTSDYNPPDYDVNISELLRLIQIYSTGAYHACPGQGAEDGFCLGIG